MNVQAVIQEVADQLDTIADLRSYGFAPDTVHPPAAIVTWPEAIEYDSTYARGMDRITLPVVVVVGKPSDRSTVERLGAYADGSGPRSVKAVVEAGTYTSCDSVRVMSAEFDVVTIGGIDYMAGMFDLDIGGKGDL